MSRTHSLATFLRNEHQDLPRQQLTAGATLFEQHAAADAMYLLLSGKLGVRLTAENQTAPIDIDELLPDALVGEMGLLTGRPRNATVYAVEDSELLRIDAATYERLAATNGDLFTALADTTAPRWQRLQLAAILVDIFGEMDAPLLKSVQEKLDWVNLSSGEALVRQGDSAESMYIIVNGRVQFTINEDDGGERDVGWAGRGESVGEFALLSSSTRSATVTAIRQTDVVEITRAHFDELATEHPQFMRSVARIIVERRQRSLGVMGQLAKNDALSLSLVPTADGMDLRSFAEQLAAALTPYGHVLIIDSARFDDMFGNAGAAQFAPDHPNHAAVVSWINEQESRYDYLLFMPDAEWSMWTKRCLGQSDRVLLVGRSGEPAEQGQLEQQAVANYPRVRVGLALWHSAETAYPRNTAAWLDQRNVNKHYHVRDGDGVSFGRLARRITGRAISLCLSGGGARGYVHLGVFQALGELDIPVDTIGGTSFGALIGGKYANQASMDDLLGDAKKYARNDALFDRTLPLVALNTSAKLDNFCQAYYGDQQIEDLWIPYFAIATNLSQATAQVNQRGSIAAAIRKSISIPGVFAPVIEDGDMIVDGGVMNNFPVDLTIEQAESARVIGVHCAPRAAKKRSYDMTSNISGWSVLGQRLNPFAKNPRVPAIAATIMRTFDVNSLQLARENEKLCDLLLQPEPTKFNILDFERYADIMQLGYERSIDALRDWQQAQPDL